MPSPISSNIDWVYLVEAQPYDPAGPGTVTIYLATRPVFFDANDATAPNRIYRGWLTQALTSKRSMFGGEGLIGGTAFPTQAAILGTVGDEFADERAYWKTLRWSGWPVTILRGQRGAARSTYETLLRGTFAAEPDFQKTNFSIPVGDLGQKLQGIFCQTTYTGAGGFNGGADLKGRYKPDAVGQVYGVEGVWVDTANGWMDFCASGFNAAPSKVTDGANALVADPANPPAAGKYYVDTANGRLRFGSAPTFGYRADFVSAFASGSTKIGSITSAILTRAGFAGGDIDSSAFTALDTSRPEKVGWVSMGEETYQAMIDALVGRAFCFLTADPSNGGKATIGKVALPTATAPTDGSVTAVITDRDIVPGSFKRTGRMAPPWRLDILAQKNWRVLDDGRLAGGALTADKDFAREEWRTVPKTNSTTQTEFPLSKPRSLETPFVDLTEASTVGDDWQPMLTVPQPTAELTIAASPFALKMGAEVWVQSDVNEENVAAIVADIDESAQSSQVKLLLWALTEP